MNRLTPLRTHFRNSNLIERNHHPLSLLFYLEAHMRKGGGPFGLKIGTELSTRACAPAPLYVVRLPPAKWPIFRSSFAFFKGDFCAVRNEAANRINTNEERKEEAKSEKHPILAAAAAEDSVISQRRGLFPSSP